MGLEDPRTQDYEPSVVDDGDKDWYLNLAEARGAAKNGESNFGKGFAVGASVSLMTVAAAFSVKSMCCSSNKTDDF